MPSIDQQSVAASRFFQMVRDFSARREVWQSAIRYQTKPDERTDLTLVSERVYGTREEWLAVQAAAGLDSIEYELGERLLILPTAEQLSIIKSRSGFESIPSRRAE